MTRLSVAGAAAVVLAGVAAGVGTAGAAQVPTYTAQTAGRAGTSPACSGYYGQHWASGWPKMFGATSWPSRVCGYRASQLRAAYGMNGTSTGRGQTIAMVELGLAPGLYRTLTGYAAAMKGYTGQVTLSGYDTMTGLGTPDGQAFLTALRAFP